MKYFFHLHMSEFEFKFSDHFKVFMKIWPPQESFFWLLFILRHLQRGFWGTFQLQCQCLWLCPASDPWMAPSLLCRGTDSLFFVAFISHLPYEHVSIISKTVQIYFHHAVCVQNRDSSGMWRKWREFIILFSSINSKEIYTKAWRKKLRLVINIAQEFEVLHHLRSWPTILNKEVNCIYIALYITKFFTRHRQTVPSRVVVSTQMKEG